MADETKTDPAPRGSESDSAAPAAAANGTPAPRARRAAAVKPAPPAGPCEDCPPDKSQEPKGARSVPETTELIGDQAAGRDYSTGLGWLMVFAGFALAFIGADLASRGRLSRRLGAAGWDESDQPQ